MGSRSNSDLASLSAMRMHPADTGRSPRGVASGVPPFTGMPWNPMPPLNRVIQRIEMELSLLDTVRGDLLCTRKVPCGVRPLRPDDTGYTDTTRSPS